MLILFAFFFSSGKGPSGNLKSCGTRQAFHSAIIYQRCLSASSGAGRAQNMLVAFLSFGSLLWFRPFLNPPSVREEPEQLSHSVFSPPLLFSLAFSRFSLVAHAVFKMDVEKYYIPRVYSMFGMKETLVSLLNLLSLFFPPSHLLYLFLQVCYFQTSLFLSMSQKLSAIHVCFRYASGCFGLITRRNLPAEAQMPLGNPPLRNTVYKALPEGAQLQSREAAQALFSVIICVFAKRAQNAPCWW